MKAKVPYPMAIPLALKVLSHLESACERIEIAGSIRRKSPVIGDIELVCIPKLTIRTNLFGETVYNQPDQLNAVINDLVNQAKLSPPQKNGDKYKQFTLAKSGLQLDLFITTPEQWPVIFAIRTGSAEFAKSIVTPIQNGGRLNTDCHISEGRVWRNGVALPLQTEADYFELLGGWVAPEDRH